MPTGRPRTKKEIKALVSGWKKAPKRGKTAWAKEQGISLAAMYRYLKAAGVKVQTRAKKSA